MKVVLTLTFGLLWFADTWLTVCGVVAVGTSYESNPIMRWVIIEWGLAEFYAVKMAVLMFWVLLAERAHWGIHVALNVIMIPVVYMGIKLYSLIY